MPTTKTSDNDIANLDIQLQSFDNNPDIELNIIQAISRLFGYDAANHLWRRIPVDSQGRMLVTNAEVQGSAPTITYFNLAQNTETLLLSTNNSRRSMMIINISVQPFQLYFSTPKANFLNISAGLYYFDDLTLSAVYAFCTTVGCNLRVLEY